MARPLRIEFPGAIYHVMSRGNARQTVFCDDSDYQRLIKGLETVVGRLGWDLLCFVLMPNHFHLAGPLSARPFERGDSAGDGRRVSSLSAFHCAWPKF